MARRGNGRGRGGPAQGPGWGGPANGAGWGGPARGIGHNSGCAAPFEEGNRAAAGPHSSGQSKRKEMLEVLYHLAFHAPSQALQVWAAVAWLNRVEGPCRQMASPDNASIPIEE